MSHDFVSLPKTRKHHLGLCLQFAQDWITILFPYDHGKRMVGTGKHCYHIQRFEGFGTPAALYDNCHRSMIDLRCQRCSDDVTAKCAERSLGLCHDYAHADRSCIVSPSLNHSFAALSRIHTCHSEVDRQGVSGMKTLKSDSFHD